MANFDFFIAATALGMVVHFGYDYGYSSGKSNPRAHPGVVAPVQQRAATVEKRMATQSQANEEF